MDSSAQALANATKLNNDLFELVEKLRIQLDKKDEESAKDKQENEKLSADLALEKARADKLETESHNVQKMIDIHQMSWEGFPYSDSDLLLFYIETQSGSSNGEFLYLSAQSHNYYLRSLADVQIRDLFEFTKNSDDNTFTIHTEVEEGEGNSLQEIYLQTTDSDSSRVEFTANKNKAGKFVLFFHQQNHHIGVLADICTLDGYFLCMDNENYVVANSRTAPAPTAKFMITPSL